MTEIHNENLPLISVIVPAHNIENYLEECVKSILRQTYANIELLILENGSKDNTYTVAEKLSHQDSRIKLHKLSKSGVCFARNFGLEKATGGYIAFIDGDDLISDDYLQSLYDGIRNYNADISMTPFSLYYDDLHIKPIHQPFVDGLYIGKDKCSIYGERFIWGKLYTRALLCGNNIVYDENFEGVEDWLYFIEALVNSRGVVVLPSGRYFYRQRRAGQITGRKSFEKSRKEVTVNIKLKELLLRKNIFDDYRASYEHEFARNIIGKTFALNPFKGLSRKEVEIIIEPVQDELLAIELDKNLSPNWLIKWFGMFQFCLRHGYYRGFFKFIRYYRNLIMKPLGIKYR